MREMERVLKPGGLLLLTFDFHPRRDERIVGFTGDDFRKKVLGSCALKIAHNEPDFRVEDWNGYLSRINDAFQTKNPNTSFGVALTKA